MKINYSVIPGKFQGLQEGGYDGEQSYDQGSYYKDSALWQKRTVNTTAKFWLIFKNMWLLKYCK